MTFIKNSSAKKFLLALVLSLFSIPFARFLSPGTVIDGNAIYLAWLPLSVILSMMLLFGRHAVSPLIIAFAVTNAWLLPLPAPQSLVLLFCQLFAPMLSCGILYGILGKRWRFGLPNRHMGTRIFWACFFAPMVLKGTMYLAGRFLDFPLSVSGFFVSASVVYSLVDIQSLICAGLIFTMLFYYPLRMLINPRYARKFWKRHILPAFGRKQWLFTANWLVVLTALLLTLCTPFESEFIAGYLVPVIFILFFLVINRFSYPLICLVWGISAFFLVAYNRNFLQGVSTEYALSFVLSVLISFTICLLYMAQIQARSNIIKRKWHNQALQDPLTGLPNLRAFESYLSQHPRASVCCLRMDNLEFLSRHYGMMMRVHCKRMITRDLQPLLGPEEKLFQLPGSELLLVLHCSETAARLAYIVDFLNSQAFNWQGDSLDLEFGAAWGAIEGEGEALHHTLGQLSWLSEQACAARRVLALDSSLATVSDNTTERVMQLSRVKKALAEGGLQLYAQPIVSQAGDRYHEILARMTWDEKIITPDQFIPVIAQFNLSKRFDLLVVETLFRAMKTLPGERFSVNLMPFTLMQKESANKILSLFSQYDISPALVTIEITEQQAFSGSEISMLNIRRLREYGCQIAIDDFGTGYANYERLKRLEADIVKIDGCFVRDILTDPVDEMIVKSICELAKVKKLTLVAEFVETEAQRELLYKMGVDYLQGYLIGKPRPLEELRA
ncbi:MAG TPA: EAL domain-containing protein [Scandinavium sp.]|jgi:EAL domain-containing protein (putative c-di-GMP-specific phosphodiesterase class I)/GGDEF domain-containing protein|uniref:sensor domain-containing phosphodiesterase n=1 Tax=Scandinavium sp. TaxID=2830653 RepID=UPI002E345334|nr:EAL domain-containing protein [Scandinavium sp.]HEX4503966.1 EAL domain-containing protein [Scandinavium sp.]